MNVLRARVLGSSAFVSFCLALFLLVLGLLGRQTEKRVITLQSEFNDLQTEINRGMISQRTAEGIVNDLIPMASTKPEVENVLMRHGIYPNKKPSPGRP